MIFSDYVYFFFTSTHQKWSNCSSRGYKSNEYKLILIILNFKLKLNGFMNLIKSKILLYKFYKDKILIYKGYSIQNDKVISKNLKADEK